MARELTTGLRFEGYGTGAAHAAAVKTGPCPKCQGRGVVGKGFFTPLCPLCLGAKVMGV
jgi:hypothetical protein